MWRRVTRGLVLATLVSLAVPALLAQTTESFGSLDFPDPSVTQSVVIVVRGWFLDPSAVWRVAAYVDDQFIANANTNLPRIDIIEAYPNYPGIQHIAPGFQIGMLASRFTNGAHTISVHVFRSDGTMTELGRRTINVDNSLNQAPFGNVDIPDLSGTFNASGSFPVSGWALDTDGVSKGEVLIDNGVVQNAMYGDARPDVGNTIADCAFSPIFNNFVNCYGLPRFDVERFYPNYPDAPRSGFLFTLDVGALLALGVRPGNHILTVRVGDEQQTFTVLPNRDGIPVFFECAENRVAAAVGFIDVPQTNDFMKGTVTFQGWAALEGSTQPTAVEILVDGDFKGSAQLNFPRPDVVVQYPYLFNSQN